MKRIVRLTESDLARIVRRVVNENTECNYDAELLDPFIKKMEKVTGIEIKGSAGGGDSYYSALKILMGINSWNCLSGEDLTTRITNYEKYRSKKNLSELPSGDMISLILTLK